MTVAAWLPIVEDLPGAQPPLRVLVLGDPHARTCRELSAAGHHVVCCPDEQRVIGAPDHVGTVVGRAVDLVGSDMEVDVVVAIDGWRRLVAVHPPTTMAQLLDWVAARASVMVVEAPRRPLAPDLNELGPFEVLPLLGRFAFLHEVPADDADDPIVLASDAALRAGAEWIPADDVIRLNADDSSAAYAPVRSFRVSGQRIVKVECASEEYFERTQVVGEALFLADATARQRDALGLPAVLSFDRGRSVVTLVREEVPATEAPALQAQLDSVVQAAVDIAAEGLFHNDVRPWNIVWTDSGARLIDYSEVSEHDDDVRDLPQVLALAGTLAALATDEIRGGVDFHVDVMTLASTAGLIERWPLKAQLTDPWLNLPARHRGIRISLGMSATQIIENVLAATHG